MNTFSLSVPSYKIENFVKLLAKINRSAKKIGSEGLEVVGEKTTTKTILLNDNTYCESVITYSVKEITLMGDIPVIEGFDIVGHISFKEGASAVVTPFCDSLDTRYRTSGQVCEHCKTNRKRNELFVLRSGDSELQVGTSCLDKYTGNKTARELAALTQVFNEFKGLGNDLTPEEKEFFSGNVAPESIGYDLHSFLIYTSGLVKKEGYLTAKSAEISTPEAIFYMLRSNNGEDKQFLRDLRDSVTEAEKTEIKEMVRAEKDALNPSAQNDFSYRLSQIATFGYVTSSNKNFAGYMIKKMLDSKKAGSEFADSYRKEAVKTRVKKAKLEFIRCASFENMYGITHISTFKDENGNCIITKSSNKFDCDMLADFTIKEHTVYEGIKQTVVTRLKCVEKL